MKEWVNKHLAKARRSTIKGRIRPCFEAKQGKASRTPNPDRLANCNHLKRIQLQNAGSRPNLPCRPGHGSTRGVDRVLSGRCTGQSFNKLEPVQPPSLGSTHQAGPSLITMCETLVLNLIKKFIMNHFKNINCKTCQGKKFSKKSNESEIVRKINIKNDFNQKK